MEDGQRGIQREGEENEFYTGADTNLREKSQMVDCQEELMDVKAGIPYHLDGNPLYKMEEVNEQLNWDGYNEYFNQVEL